MNIVLLESPRLKIHRLGDLVSVSVKGDDAFWVGEDLELVEWCEFIKREARALGMLPSKAEIKPFPTFTLAEILKDAIDTPRDDSYSTNRREACHVFARALRDALAGVE